MTEQPIRIGCSSGFWGDSAYAAEQLVQRGRIDYLVSDYLSEITLSLLARARQKNPQAGFPPDFVDALAPLLPEIKKQGIRVVSNAGGINPAACREALLAAAKSAGVSLRVACVEGDDLMPQLEAVQAARPVEMFSGSAFPRQPISMNAYLGARPIAAALDTGVDIVLTGRSVDSAVVLGVLMHAFGWRDEDPDLLAAGSLAGHIVECGPQSTGGLFTDWTEVPGWDDMGYPIVECRADGSFVVTKPEGTGGLVSVGTVAEQVTYEIGDPAAYVLPDVVCDFTGVKVAQDGPHRVRVSGARGRAPTPTYKVSVTYMDGWRVLTTLMVAGYQAAAKARRMGEAILARTGRLIREAGMGDYREVSLEVIGAEDTYGPRGRYRDTAREVVLKLGLRHDSREALELFAREMTQAGVAMAQGTTGLLGGRPSPSPVVRLFSFLMDKQRVCVRISEGKTTQEVPVAPGKPFREVAPAGVPAVAEPAEPEPADSVPVPLVALAWGRSGDKGDDANIGIVARNRMFVPALRRELTTQRIADFYAHYLQGEVIRYEWPGLNGFNFVLKRVLGGGGVASLRYDPQGKTYAQMLMDLPIRVPRAWLGAGGPLEGWKPLEE